jgi:amino acid adenylation domain-containing protein
MSQKDVELVYELSPMQQAMLFSSLYAPGSGVYVVQLSLRLTGRLDLSALEQAWREVVERHGALRTGFYWEDLEKPVQVVYRDVDLAIHRESWRGLSAGEQSARLQAWLDADRERGFDLGEPPLMRLALFDLGAESWSFVWSQHHLVMDGWSLGLVLKELFTAYAALAGGGQLTAQPERPYRDYIAWLQRQDTAAVESFWRTSLAGIPAPTLVAGGDGRSTEQTVFRNARRLGRRLSEEATAALRETARHHRLTLNTLVQGAWALVLARSSGQRDVIFGSTVSGRPADLAGADSMVGLFINTLPVRAKLEPRSGLLPWLNDLQARQAEARQFEHAPLFEVQTWSGLPAGRALFDNVLIFESYPLDGALGSLLPDLTLSDLAVTELANYPLSVVVVPGSELSLEIVHDATRIDGPAAARLLERLEGLLHAFAGTLDLPQISLGDLPALLDGERQALLLEHNDTSSGDVRDASLPELFAAVAVAHPEAPAVVEEGGEDWSYRWLDEASNRLARHLAAHGVRAGERVGIAMERSAGLIAGLLAILKTGAAYVPLDPGYPDERLAFMLEDCGVTVVIVNGRTRDRLAGLGSGALLVCLDRDREAVAAREAAPLPPLSAPESLAYVVYTSGSTGRPKGVAVPHRAVVRLVAGQSYLTLAPADRLSFNANTSFDAATFEIWAVLLHGAALVVTPQDLLLSTADLAAHLERQRVTVLHLTAALFAQVGREEPQVLTPLRCALFGGEASAPAAVARALTDGRPRRLLQMYGPTESTAFATFHPVTEVAPGAATLPIGRPLASTAVYVLDAWGELAPWEQAGELCIGGERLAWGYLNRPDLTAERFVPDPWRAEPGGRLYRTGDLVRRRADGALEFLGRIDQQVKIRGFRIEPGEVEAAVAEHPSVDACAVVARRDAAGQTGEPRLVAYVVPAAGARLTEGKLRNDLKRVLPDYMLPSATVFLEALPLTPNGKVDRKALPAPEEVSGQRAEYAAPSDPVEELLAGIWAGVLGRERIGIHDDFFAVGGHSLLATQVMSRLRGVLGVELPLRRLFEVPTIAGLARALREESGDGEEIAEAPPLVPVPRDGDLPLSFAQQRLWFIDQLEPGNPGYNVTTAARLHGDLSVPRLTQAFAEVVRRHEVLRTTFASRDGRPVQVIAEERIPGLPVIDLAGLPPEAREPLVRTLAVQESLWSFDLQRGPLLHLRLVRLAEREHLLVVTVHHIVSDGWSMGVLMREVQALYRGEELPELPVQYADFAVWQRLWLAGVVLERQLAYWRERLAGTTGVLELPTDRPRPAVLSLRGGETRFRLDSGLSRRIVEMGRREGATSYMILASGLFALLSRLSGQKDLNLGSPIAGRTLLETEGLIGFFVNTLILRASLGKTGRAESFYDLLAQVREASLGAYAHQDLPFEKLVDEIQPERDLTRSPLVQVALAVNNLLPAADLEGLALVPEDVPSQVAKFDLAFILSEENRAEERDGRFTGWLQYATDLYDAATAVRLTRHFTHFLDELTAAPEQPLLDLSYLTAEERHQVLAEWNDTAGFYRPGALLHQLFAEQADAQPEATAVVWEGEAWTYAELEARANRLAHLLAELGTGRGTPVGVWMERSHHMLAAVLGVLGAGGTYVPLDPAWPAERVEAILTATGAPVILASRALFPSIEEMRWRLPRLDDAVCLDAEAPEVAPEPLDAESVRSLWDTVAERATDRVSAGGFVSRFTGQPFRDEEVDEYRDRVLALAAPWLQPDARVLEVGCGSGLILWEMARRVKACTGIDPSPRTQERNRAHAQAEGIANVDLVDLHVGFAHEIGDLFPAGSFDLIVLASTAQFFPGPRYLETVVAAARRLLAPGGAVLIADVMDARRRAELQDALTAAGAPARQGARELWLDEDLFRDLGGEVLHRTEGFANELGYRFDVVMPQEAPHGERRKRLWTGWHTSRQPASRPVPLASPEDIAYVIHTSGSTGAPKGIAVQHAPAVNLVGWINDTFGVGPQDRLLFVTSLCFDLSVYDVFGVLAAGGTVHVAPEAALREPEHLARLLREEPVTVWDSAPAALQQLAPLFPPASAHPLRLVMLSGDWIPVRLPDQVRASFPGAQVMALGGATEATVWSNWFPVRTVDPRWPSIPYGRPITAARYHVLDEGMQPCPVGVPGDLYIGGRCLCVGYAGQPALTAAQFVPDPFAPPAEAGGRLYKTGDRARFFADGNLEFLGRVDQQVKVRGYRIELGEIEVALLRHPAVREAVVLVREDRPGDRMLAAYVVPRNASNTADTAGTAGSDLQSLRSFLWEKLPSYMVPSAFVTLPALPVTANGKLDRQALPAPERVRGEGGAAAPSDPVEELLADLFAEVLGLDLVGVHESFFTLGGHSLLATQLMSRVRATLKVEVPLRELFEAPTVSELARVVRAARQEGSFLAPPITPVPPALRTDLPVSFAQQRLWLVDQLEPGNAAYNIPFAVRLTGEISVDVMERVFAEVVRRHEALRTTFASRDGKLVQVIVPPESVMRGIEVTDLSYLPEAQREEQALSFAVVEAQRPFDLESGPLLRLGLLRLGERDHVLLVTLHHIVSDGWSMGVLLREVGSLHAALSQGLPSPLPELPVQYADFAVWQRDWLQGKVLAAQLDFWKRRLEGAPRVLELPLDRPRPSIQTFAGAVLPLALSPATSRSIRELCRERGVTPFMALLAAWGVLLGRHAGQDDVPVGTPVAGRNRREVEDLIGFFVNTLVMRVDLFGAPAFTDLLDRVRDMSLDAFAHQDLPFERLVEALVPERDLAVSPLFQALFALQNAPGRPLAVPGLVLAPLVVDSGMTKFDLTLTVWETADGFSGMLEHNTDLFDRATMERLLARFAALLEGALARPGTAVQDLPLLLPEELAQIRDWNATATEYPREACLTDLFAAVARQHPDAMAIVSESDMWTYRRLDEESNRLARHLYKLGVRPESAVGISMERCPELILGILAILKAGGVYVPLDASYPPDRLSYMLADTGAFWTVVHAETRDRLAGRDTRLIGVDAADWEQQEATPLGVRVPAESLAYVIYTSGSTGLPKGVGVPHRAIVRLVRDTNYVRLGPGDRTGQVANISFDAATYEIWGALLNGGAVVVIPREVVLSPLELAWTLRDREVTSMFLTSALFTKMSQEAPDAFSGMNELLVGGEAVDPQAARTVLSGGGPRRLLNGYGPTESTTFAAWHPIAEVPPETTNIPIGLPLANTSLYVLDRWQGLVPLGAVGELCIGGDGLADGYVNRPELTAERFVPHPWGDGDRLYRTGDLVRHRKDGPLEYLGRLDDQVKIRGFRIEPGEIEAVLSGHPAVGECAVLARRDTPDELRLVAYVVGRDGQVPRPEDLRAWLAERLPEYMLPAAAVVLPALPLTANGKVDRRALPAPERTLTGLEEGFATPTGPVEELLAGIVAEVLALNRPVGIHDDFFALGGHSLLATQIVSRIRQVFGVDLLLRELFEAPTVAQMARVVTAARASGVPQAPAVEKVPREGDLPLSFAQQRLWFMDQLEPGNAAYNISSAMRLTGEVSAELLAQIFAEVVRRHEVLRTTFAATDGRPVQVIAPELRPDLRRIDLSGLPEPEREPAALRLAVEEARRPFDLQHGPLLRLALVRLEREHQILLMTLHHIVSDGWSMGVLTREISILYEAFSQGWPSPLPELPVQYADFAVSQRGWLQGAALEEQLTYWKRQLDGAPRVLDLPTDRPRPAQQTYRGARYPIALPAALSDAVRDLGRLQGVTPFMALLAALSVVLGRHAGQDDLLLGSPIAGRNRSEIEHLIGFFVNTLVMRADLSGAPSFSDLLGRVREMALDAFVHQELPFERLVEELVPERDLSRAPLLQAVFALQNAPGQPLSLPGLVLEPLNVDSGLSQLDFTLLLWDGPGGFSGGLQLKAGLFDPGTAERLLARFHSLLEAAVADPGRSVADLPLLLPAEQQQLLDWSGAGRSQAQTAPGLTFPELFATQVALTPDAPAVIFAASPEEAPQQLSYRDLDRQSALWARRLRDLGAGPEVLVGICVRRSPRMLVAVLAVLRAGGAYVPLDPAHPADRLSWMLDDAGVDLVLAEAETLELLSGAGRPVQILLLEDAPRSPDAGAEIPRVAPAPQQAAYVIYTSGSTGQPKGSVAVHGGLAAFTTALADLMELTSSDRVLQLASLSFDASAVAIYPTLSRGAAIVLHPDPATLSTAELLALCAERQVTVLELPAALWRRTVQEMEAAGLRFGGKARLFMTGGESLSPAALRQWGRTVAPDARLVSSYGLTEATVVATAYLAEGVSACDAALSGSPLGRPLAGTSVHLLDARLQPVPVGVPAEIHLGGAGVTRGYLRRPDLTAAAFLPDPWGPPGSRLYRTGDRARRLKDGGLESLGRRDLQVKIRGFRIELEEIEAVLASHPAVRECVVVVREDALGSPLLVAYLAGREDLGQEISTGGLRAFLGRRLPDPMVPPVFAVLPSLPLSASGKIDRRSLSTAAWARNGSGADRIPPRTPTEETVAEIWRELLGLDEVGVEDSFFVLGGHSLLAAQVVARIRQAFAVDLPLRELFQRPTVAGLADLIDSRVEPPLEEGELTALLSEIDLASDGEARSRLDDLLSAKEGA